MKMSAVFHCKESEIQAKACEIEKIVELTKGEYAQFYHAPLRDYPFIADNKNCMYVDENQTHHCLLVLGEGHNNGFLVESEGYDYARYLSFVPNARQIVEHEQRYNCIQDLECALMNAANEVVSCANAHDGDGDFRALIDDLADEHGFDKTYIPLLADMIEEHSSINDVMVFSDEIIVSVNRQEEKFSQPNQIPDLDRSKNHMKANLLMGNQYELRDTREVEITAVIRLPEDEYQALLDGGSLPDEYSDVLKTYTSAELQRGSGTISKYNAALVICQNSEDGVAVCGSNGSVSYAAQFPNAREWLDRRVQQMADYVTEYAHVPGRVKDEMSLEYNHFRDLFGTEITADNGIGDLLVQELRERDEINNITTQDECFEIEFNPDIDYDDDFDYEIDDDFDYDDQDCGPVMKM